MNRPGARAARQGPLPAQRIRRFVRRDHARRRPLVSAAGTPVYEDQGHITGATVILQDVTKLRRFDELKNDLVATVAHEFRTPLTSLRMAIHLCLEGVPARSARSRPTCSTRPARIASGCSAPSTSCSTWPGSSRARSCSACAACRPASWCRPALDAYRRARGAKTLKLTQRHRLWRWMRCWPIRTACQLVFSNLLANAIRHTPAGGTDPGVESCRSTGRCASKWPTSGEGIPHRISGTPMFEKFFRVPGTPSGAAGLGLSLSKEIVEAHHGANRRPQQAGQRQHVLVHACRRPTARVNRKPARRDAEQQTRAACATKRTSHVGFVLLPLPPQRRAVDPQDSRGFVHRVGAGQHAENVPPLDLLQRKSRRRRFGTSAVCNSMRSGRPRARSPGSATRSRPAPSCCAARARCRARRNAFSTTSAAGESCGVGRPDGAGKEGQKPPGQSSRMSSGRSRSGGTMHFDHVQPIEQVLAEIGPSARRRPGRDWWPRRRARPTAACASRRSARTASPAETAAAWPAKWAKSRRLRPETACRLRPLRPGPADRAPRR